MVPVHSETGGATTTENDWESAWEDDSGSSEEEDGGSLSSSSSSSSPQMPRDIQFERGNSSENMLTRWDTASNVDDNDNWPASLYDGKPNPSMFHLLRVLGKGSFGKVRLINCIKSYLLSFPSVFL